MASKATNRIVQTILPKRYYGASAQAKPQSAVKPGAKVSRLQNGLLVASLENNSPISRIGVIVKAGSRFETPENLGVTHFLRVAAGVDTKHSSAFNTVRNIQQAGATLICTGTREYIFYHSDCTRNKAETCAQFLKEVTTAPVFNPWEVADLQHRLALDRASVDTQPQLKVIDLLHQTAYRDKLGNSMYAPKYSIGKINRNQLMSYFEQHFTSGRIALVGLGVDHDFIIDLGNHFVPAAASSVKDNKAVYHGGEIRKPSGHLATYAAVAFEGPSLTNADVLHAGVLQNILGVGSNIKYGIGAGRLGQAVAKVARGPFHVSGLNAQYTDSALLGLSVGCAPYDSAAVLKAACAQVTDVLSGNVNDAEVKRAKAQLKAQVAMSREDGDNLLLDIAEQAMGSEEILASEDLIKRIDAITTASVAAAAKKLKLNKPSMAAVGNLSYLPYLDELGPK